METVERCLIRVGLPTSHSRVARTCACATEQIDGAGRCTASFDDGDYKSEDIAYVRSLEVCQ